MHMFSTHLPRAQSQRGASLIEVLVAALILSLGMLSLIGIQASTSQVSKVNALRAEASRLGQDMADRIRANQAATANYTLIGAYSGNDTNRTLMDCSTAACSAANIATLDINQMRNLSRLALPRGDIRITSSTVNNLTMMEVWVMWLPAAAVGDGTDINRSAVSGTGCPAAIAVEDGTQCLLTRVNL